MRKGLLIVAAIGVLGVGYLAGQVISSLLFERELESTLKDLAARSDVQVERHDVERGWFVSRGEIVLMPQFGDGWRFELPYTARHGLLSTRAEGRLVPVRGDESTPLFGERLPGTSPLWHAEYRTLSNDITARVDLAAFRTTEGKRQFDFQGGELLLNGQHDDLRLEARIGPLDIEQGGDTLRVEPLVLKTHYQAASGEHPPRWTLETLRVASPSLGLTVDIVGELRFLGGEWEAFRLTDLESTAGRQRWLSRLDGHFTWSDPPPLVLLQLGLPLDSEMLEVEIDAGKVTANDRSLSSLP